MKNLANERNENVVFRLPSAARFSVNLRDLRESNGSVMLVILVLKVRRQSLTTVIPIANLRRISLGCNFLDEFLTAPAEVFSFMRSKISAKL